MTQIPAKVADVADIREFDCALPDEVEVSVLASRLAALTHFPLVGPDSRPLNYGLVVKGGRALTPHSTLAGQRITAPLDLRLVPEFTTGADDAPPSVDEPEVAEPANESLIEIDGPRSLLHDVGLDLRHDVRIDARVHRDIEQFAAQDRHTECVGLLLGTVNPERSARIIHVSAIAPAVEAVGARTSVKMTLEAWESVLRIRDEDYPELRVLGWFHTHAGWGVFMSDSDVFVHRHFFPHPNMVAYVLDPTSGRDGFFYWHDGIIGQCPSYGLVGSEEEIGLRKRARRKRGRPDLRDCLILALLGGSLYLGFAGPGRLDRWRDAPRPATARIARHTAAPAPRPEGMDRVYTVKYGESLWIVCRRFYGDARLAVALARYNGIARPALVRVGREIKLPPKDVIERMARE